MRMCGCGCIYNWHLVIIVILIMLSTLFMRKDNEKEAAADHSYQADVFSLIQAAISEILVKLGTAIIHFLPTLTFGTWKLCLIV